MKQGYRAVVAISMVAVGTFTPWTQKVQAQATATAINDSLTAAY
jgi:hypothetical protein